MQFHEGDPPSVGRPGRRTFLATVVRQPPLSASVGVRDVDLGVGYEGDLPPVWRPGWTPLLLTLVRRAVGQPMLPASVSTHDVDEAAVAPDRRLADEGDLRAPLPRLLPHP